MPDHLHHRLGDHFRRHSFGYAVIVLTLSLSPLPSMAADLVTTGDIANGAVTRPKLAANSVVSGKIENGTVSGADLKNASVGTADLKTSARGAKVVRYNIGSWDPTNPGQTWTVADLPDVTDAATVANSTWSATMNYTDPPGYDFSYVVPGYGHNRTTFYDLLVTDTGEVYIERIGPIETGVVYEDIRIYRTVATSTFTFPTAKVGRASAPR